jgi:two-component system, chemotaxis family, sensor kinase CheA
MSDPDPQFESSFMDDYFAEADEHLLAVRRCLLMLDGAQGAAAPPAVLEELFRSCHSLKGISAMVELREAELLAHHMESALRAIRQAGVAIDGTKLDTLLAGANALEAVIVAKRQGSPPSEQAVVAALSALASLPAAVSPETSVRAPAGATTTASSLPIAAAWRWLVTFVPSPDLVARGVKVDTIRARLLQLGTIVSVTPRVQASGGISFEFEMETEDEASLSAFRGDGVSYHRVLGAVSAVPTEPSLSSSEPSASPRAWEVASGAPANFVRVDLARLDDLMRVAGDLVVTRSRLEDTLRRVERHVPAREFRSLQEHDSLMERQLRDLRDGIMRVRLVPVGEVFRRMPFVVRDLARDTGKRVQLEITGQGTEIDKFLIERMMDPILHLVRNAVGHGIETVERRIAAGKPPDGTIRLSASTVGESVIIEIADDGAGIDLAAIARRAPAQGIRTEDGVLDSRVLLDIICASGFSTREQADRISGRGVGMDVVRGTVQELGGALDVATEPGRGTTFTITLPLTLAVVDAIIAQIGNQTFAVPQSAIHEVIEVAPASLRVMEHNELITYRGRALPIVRLGRLFRIDTAPRPRLHAIVVGTGLSAVGLLVDRVAGHREIVVKTIADPLIRVDGVSGATELGDGRLVLILDVGALSRGVRQSRAGARASA